MQKLRFSAALISAAFAVSVYAQRVEVVDLSAQRTENSSVQPVVQRPITLDNSSTVVDTSAMIVEETTTNSGALYVQMQNLQQEVMQLRNIVEQQTRQLQELRELSLQRYIDIDKRLATGGVAVSTSPVEVTPVAADRNAAEPAVNVEPSVQLSGTSDVEAYDNAYQLVKNRQYEEAIPQFERFLIEYSTSVRRPNALYWLGQLYMVTNQFDQAVDNFSTLRVEFPEHAKTPDGTFKLATLYFKQGNKARCKSLLDELIASNGAGNPTTRQAAESFLRDNF